MNPCSLIGVTLLRVTRFGRRLQGKMDRMEISTIVDMAVQKQRSANVHSAHTNGNAKLYYFAAGMNQQGGD